MVSNYHKSISFYWPNTSRRVKVDDMTSLIPPEKQVSVIHFNPDWGYLAYIEKAVDIHGKATWKVVRVSLAGNS